MTEELMTESSPDAIIANHVALLSKTMLFNDEFEIESEIYKENERIIFGQKIANILVAGEDLRIIIRIHYTDQLGDYILHNYSASKVVTSQKIDDYFLECCNLLAGRLKQSFYENDFNVGISIPVKTKGFDDLFFAVTSNEDVTFEWHWDLTSGKESHVHFSLFIELLSDDKIKTMNFNHDTSDDVEFF